MLPPEKLRVLLLVHSFNSLAQRFFVELGQWGHEVSVEYDIHDSVTLEAISLFKPDLIIAPYLKRILSADILDHHTCLIVHPGIVGDRGPSSLDRAIMDGKSEWGVTILKAVSEVDAGPVLASRSFAMRDGPKSSLYRDELTEAAVLALEDVLSSWSSPKKEEIGARPSVAKTPWLPLLTQTDRRIDWHRDDTATVLRKIHCSDAHPGVNDQIMGLPVKIYGAYPEGLLKGPPGQPVAQRHGALCVGTVDGAVWITHLKRLTSGPDERSIKLPAGRVLGAELLASVPHDNLGYGKVTSHVTYQDIYYEVEGGVGYLHFDIHGGALSCEQCARLREAYGSLSALSKDGLRVVVMCGGDDFWMNGIDLNAIEASSSPADASWASINALNDFVRDLIETTSLYTVAAMAGGAGAGGAFTALACDEVWARAGIVLSPHYKNMGNLYGSEYWTYLMAKKVGLAAHRQQVLALRVPIGVREAMRLGLVDQCADVADKALFHDWVRGRADEIAARADLSDLLEQKRESRRCDEQQKPLAQYREEELAHMKLNFYGWDPSYHKARYNFVHRVALSRTPRYLARHRDPTLSNNKSP